MNGCLRLNILCNFRIFLCHVWLPEGNSIHHEIPSYIIKHRYSYITIYNHIQPRITMYNHRLYICIYIYIHNHLQTNVTIYNLYKNLYMSYLYLQIFITSTLPSRCSRPSSSARRKSAKSATRVRRMPSGTLGPSAWQVGGFKLPLWNICVVQLGWVLRIYSLRWHFWMEKKSHVPNH